MVAGNTAINNNNNNEEEASTRAVLVELAIALVALLSVLGNSSASASSSFIDLSVVAFAFGFALARGRSRAAVIPYLVIWLPIYIFSLYVDAKAETSSLYSSSSSSLGFAKIIPGLAFATFLIPPAKLVLPQHNSYFNIAIALGIAFAGTFARASLNDMSDIAQGAYINYFNNLFIFPVKSYADAAFAGWLLARPPSITTTRKFSPALRTVAVVSSAILFAIFAPLIANSSLSEFDGFFLPLVAFLLLAADSFPSPCSTRSPRILYVALVLAVPLRRILDTALCSANSKLCSSLFLFSSLVALPALLALLALGVLYYYLFQIPVESILHNKFNDYVANWPMMPYDCRALTKWPKRNNSKLERFGRDVLYYLSMVLFTMLFVQVGGPVAKKLGNHSRQPLFCYLPESMYECGRRGGGDGMLGQWSRTWSFKWLLRICRLISVLSLPTFILNIVGHISFPRANWNRIPSIKNMLRYSEVTKESQQPLPSDIKPDDATITDTTPLKLDLDFVLYFRYVTRGNNPKLTIENCKRGAKVLRDSGIGEDMWKVEVVTDTALYVSEEIDDPDVYEIVVPSTYNPPGGAMYKARALNYAIEKSPAKDFDWIIHLDEETTFDEDTVNAIVQHCGQQTYAVRVEGSQNWPAVGQGLIVYGRAMLPSLRTLKGDTSRSWMSSLADSARVADDCGRFRLQYEFGEVYLGMHGSFVVSANIVEKSVTFDHGVEGSIAEDAHFALLARSMGVRFAWIDALMFEQSPFSFRDFVRQRARWLVGGLLVVNNDTLPLSVRIVMRTLSTLWAAMPLTYSSVLIAIILGSLETQQGMTHSMYQILLPASLALSVWSYLFGYCVTFYGQGMGYARFLSMLYIQMLLMPVFGVMELCGVVYALANYTTLSRVFHVVQKHTESTTSSESDNGEDNNENENTPLLKKR